MAKKPAGTQALPAERLLMPIVSSAHLVSPQSTEMSEFEYGLIVAGNAFHRWVVHCMSAAGLKDLTPLDVLVLHHVTSCPRQTADRHLLHHER
jgi:predicted MarR family transcription regulator